MSPSAKRERTDRSARRRAGRAGARRRSSRPAASPASDEALRTLRGYADRGVFRGFALAPLAGGRREVRFRWLVDADLRVKLDPGTGRLTFVDLLPDVPVRSAMDRALRGFLRERSDPALPEHRRIDPRRVEVRAVNRRGRISVALTLVRRGAREREDWAYAAKKGVSLVNEIFHGFLRGPYYEYMVRSLGEPEE